jgi:hypothetical protein
LNYFKNFDTSFVEGIKKPRIQFDWIKNIEGLLS